MKNIIACIGVDVRIHYMFVVLCCVLVKCSSELLRSVLPLSCASASYQLASVLCDYDARVLAVWGAMKILRTMRRTSLCGLD